MRGTTRRKLLATYRPPRRAAASCRCCKRGRQGAGLRGATAVTWLVADAAAVLPSANWGVPLHRLMHILHIFCIFCIFPCLFVTFCISSDFSNFEVYVMAYFMHMYCTWLHIGIFKHELELCLSALPDKMDSMERQSETPETWQRGTYLTAVLF